MIFVTGIQELLSAILSIVWFLWQPVVSSSSSQVSLTVFRNMIWNIVITITIVYENEDIENLLFIQIKIIQLNYYDFIISFYQACSFDSLNMDI